MQTKTVHIMYSMQTHGSVSYCIYTIYTPPEYENRHLDLAKASVMMRYNTKYSYSAESMLLIGIKDFMRRCSTSEVLGGTLLHHTTLLLCYSLLIMHYNTQCSYSAESMLLRGIKDFMRRYLTLGWNSASSLHPVVVLFLYL